MVAPRRPARCARIDTCAVLIDLPDERDDAAFWTPHPDARFSLSSRRGDLRLRTIRLGWRRRKRVAREDDACDVGRGWQPSRHCRACRDTEQDHHDTPDYCAGDGGDAAVDLLQEFDRSRHAETRASICRAGDCGIGRIRHPGWIIDHYIDGAPRAGSYLYAGARSADTVSIAVVVSDRVRPDP